MNFIAKIGAYLAENLRIVATNPDNFEVKWTITSSRIRIYSLRLIIVLATSFILAMVLINGPFKDENEMQRLLENEGMIVKDNQIQNFSDVFWDPFSLDHSL